MKLMHARQQHNNRANAALCSSVSFCLAHTVYYLFVSQKILAKDSDLASALYMSLLILKYKKETLHVQFFFIFPLL